MSTFCYMPFETMAVDTTGHVMPCCAYRPECAPFDYTKNPITANEYFNSTELKEIQDTFLNGEVPAGCDGCIMKEYQGMLSKRQKYNNTRIKNKTKWIQNRTSPLSVEIAVSNRCNLTCVTCDSIFSSAWKQYDRNMTGHFEFNRRQEWAKNNFRIDDGFMDEILQYAKENKEMTVELIGGEPLYNKSVIQFLESFVSANLPNCLVITTNATLITDHVLSLLRQVHDLILGCSVDGTDDVYKYVRGFDFDVVDANIKKLLKLSGAARITIIPVFSIFNVFNIPRLIMWHNKIATPHTKMRLDNFVRGPYYASIENMPPFMLEPLVAELEELTTKNIDTIKEGDLEKLINTLKKYEVFDLDSQQLSLQWIEKCNIIRGMEIEKIVPGVQTYIEYVNGKS